ncbi:MAG: SBBP repeat-containing protein, partial [Candidatus Komeilibacteria bacterium]|nr:SBBP repeat-containing protein [Candidatus Komeilibacteria bacterium]
MNTNKKLGLAVALLVMAIFLAPAAAKASPVSGLDNLVASTYLGGDGGDAFYSGVILDSSGNVYAVGSAYSANFPTTTGAYQGTDGGGTSDAVISKFNSNLTQLLVSTYFGGDGKDTALNIKIDSAGNIFVVMVVGSTYMTTTTGAVQGTIGGAYDFFVAKFNSGLTSVLAGTYFGGTQNERPMNMILDASDNVYINGRTASTNLTTTTGAYQGIYGGGGNDVMIVKFNSGLTSTLASTYLGGSGAEFAGGLIFDSSGNIFVSG